MPRTHIARTTHEFASITVRDWIAGHFLDRDRDPEFTYTTLPSGGRRSWFICPQCDQRCGVLYAIDGRQACCTCGGLKYESQVEPTWQRALRRARNIRIRLGGTSMVEPFPERPRGMHLVTYERLRRGHDAAVAAYAGPMLASLRRNP